MRSRDGVDLRPRWILSFLAAVTTFGITLAACATACGGAGQ